MNLRDDPSLVLFALRSLAIFSLIVPSESLVANASRCGLFPATARIEREIAADASWRAVAPEAETSGWRAVSLRKYVRSGPGKRH